MGVDYYACDICHEVYNENRINFCERPECRLCDRCAANVGGITDSLPTNARRFKRTLRDALTNYAREILERVEDLADSEYEDDESDDSGEEEEEQDEMQSEVEEDDENMLAEEAAEHVNASNSAAAAN